MNLTDGQIKELGDFKLTPGEQALRCCRLASDLIQTGQYEEAGGALAGLWEGVGSRPELEGLGPLAAAEVLLQCGVLSGWLGSVRQIAGAQEKAKDLLSEALRGFQEQGRTAKVAEVYYELGRCYFRLGSYDESRVVLDEALAVLAEQAPQLKAKLLIRRTLVEIWTGRYHDAWDILERAREFFEAGGDALKGRWHGQMAIVFLKLATAEKRPDYADRAIIEFTAAIFHYDRAGHERYSAINLNNLAMLLSTLGRHREAHENLDRAVQLFSRLQDDGLLAQVNETRARVFVAEGRGREACHTIAKVIRTLEKGGECALLADALTIEGVAWARMGMHESSVEVLSRALDIAVDSGALSNAAHAALALIEEHGESRLADHELYRAYRRADEWLADTQDAEDIARLRACAGIVTRRLAGADLDDPKFSLKRAVLAYEAKFIERALECAHGSVTRAARMLGLRYQTLGEILKTRHKKLLRLRTPPASRRRSTVVRSQRRNRAGESQEAQTASILVVEDDRDVVNVVRDTLESEGWAADTCADGARALKEIQGRTLYDLLLLDYELPGVNGLEIVRRARQLPHRKRTPVVMLSASDVEAEAWRAGVDAFLRKPDDVELLPKMIARLLSSKR